MAKVAQPPPPVLDPKTAAFLAAFEARTGRPAPGFLRGTAEPPQPPQVPAQAPPPSSGPAWTQTPPTAAPASSRRARAARRPLSRRELVARKREASRKRESRILARIERNVRAAGGHGVGIRVVRSWIWSMCAHIVADQSGAAGRIYLRRCPNRPAVGAIMRAAFGELDQAGRPRGRYAWCDLRARRIVALGLALVALSKRSRRQGPWNACVLAIPRGAFCALLANPYDRREHKRTPAVTTVFGTHRAEGTPDNGQVGYFVALRESGAVYRQQLGKGEGHYSETCYPSGWPPNRYWVIAPEPERMHEAADRERLHELAREILDRPELGELAKAPERPPERPPGQTAPPPEL